MWSIKVTGFRSFGDKVPLEIDLTRPVTAIVGANNSGKSNVLRFFWEFGPILRLCLTSAIVADGTIGLPSNPFSRVRPLSSSSSVFNLNDEQCPITIELHYKGSADPDSHQFNDWRDSASQIKIKLKIARNGVTTAQLWCVDSWVTPATNRFQTLNVGDFFYYLVNDQSFACFFRLSDLICFEEVFFLPALRTTQFVEHRNEFNLSLGNRQVELWKTMKGSDDAAQRIIAQRIQNELATIFGYDSLHIDVDAKNAQYVVAVNNRPSVMLKEMGEGFGHFFTVLVNLSANKKLLSLVDEPETSLHASLQQEFMNLISRNTSGPVIFTTHSIGLARAVADKIISIKQVNGISSAQDFASAKNPLELIGEITFSAWRDIGCKGVLFVEGSNDTRICREWMSLLGKRHEWVILSLGGAATIDALGSEAIGQIVNLYPNVAVLIDSERTMADQQIQSKRQQFLDGCAQAKIKCHATSWHSLDNYHSQSSLSAAFGDGAKVLGPYEKLSTHGWSKKLGYQAARLMNPEEFRKTDVGEFLENL